MEIRFDLTTRQKLHDKIEQEMSRPGFWDNSVLAQDKVNQFKMLKAVLDPYRELEVSLSGQNELLEAADEGDLADLARETTELDKKLEHLEYQSYLKGANDTKNIFLSIHAGAGGDESCDWVNMLLRMYMRWLEQNDYTTQMIDSLDGDVAGLRHVTLYIKGPYAFGYLKSELGVHRLVRISPFDANSRRHTSFASVNIVPETEEEQIQLQEKDLKIDTFRAGGPGGQHVNVTDSAVRITHRPTGVVVQCQSERSQYQNKRTAMKLLTARLYAQRSQEQEEEFKKAYGAKGEIAWGYQIRSYVMQPYTLVKDHRTKVETSDVNGVLDGDLDRFIEAYLRSKQARTIG